MIRLLRLLRRRVAGQAVTPEILALAEHLLAPTPRIVLTLAIEERPPPRRGNARGHGNRRYFLMHDKPNRAAGYCRVSTAKQADEGTSLETQEALMRADAKCRGETWIRTYADAGMSGRTTEKRQALKS